MLHRMHVGTVSPSNSSGIIPAVRLFLLAMHRQGHGSAQSAQPAAAAAAPASKPLIVYFSLTGKNKIISAELKKQLNARCRRIEISFRTHRASGVLSSADMKTIFDKDAELQPFTTDLAPYNPIIICSPIWMQKLSSPARTFLKNPALKGKDVYIFASFKAAGARKKKRSW